MGDEKKRDNFEIEMGDKANHYEPPPVQQPLQPAPLASVANHPVVPILSYCASSILMTVTNKFVLSGSNFNLNFFLLCFQVCRLPASKGVQCKLTKRQSVVCVIAIQSCKSFGVITYRDFNSDEAKKCVCQASATR